MKIALACDHAGYSLKEYLKPRLVRHGWEIEDCGCYSAEPADYPLFTLRVVWRLATQQCERGLFICGNGYAMAMLANRLPGMRAAVCHDPFSARTVREMGDSNILSLGARVVAPELAWELTQLWLNSDFLGNTNPRYADRLGQIADIETPLYQPDWLARLEQILQTAEAAETAAPTASQIDHHREQTS